MIDKNCFYKILSRLGYIETGHDFLENTLAAEAWNLLEEKNHVQLRNLITFFLAVENIFIEQMSYYPNPPTNKVDKRFGFYAN